MSIIGLVLALTGGLMAAIGVPLWLEKVPPNRLYGFRTPRTVNDPDVWYPVNRLTGRDLVLGSSVGTVAVVLGDLLLVDPVQSAPILTGLMMAPILIAVLHSFWVASAFVAEHDAFLAKGGKRSEGEALRRPRPTRETEH